MKINSLSLAKITQNNSFKDKQTFKTNSLPVDTFEKSNVSFKGTSSDDIMKKIADDFLSFLPPDFLRSLTDSMLEDITNGKFTNLPLGLLDSIPDDTFLSLLSGLSKTINDFSDMVQYERMEKQVDDILEAYSDKKVRETLKRIRGQKAEDHLMTVLRTHSADDREFIISLFKSSGFKNVANIETFAQIYSRNSKPFKGQGIEAIEIYGILKSKDDLSKYSELLLHLFNEEYSKEVADYDVLNRTTAFLKQIGLNNFNEFDEKFGHLKSKFNNFEDISDKADAISYIQRTYDDKLRLIGDVIKQNPNLKVQNPEKAYSSMNDIIDYFYEQNSGKNLNGLSDVIEYASFSNKFKPIGLKQIASDFNNFNTPEDKVDFYLFLKDCEISISDFNSLVGKSVVSDVEPLSFFVNKTELTDSISQIKRIKAVDSFEFYKKFRDVLNATYDEQTESTEDVKTLVGIIDRFKLKDSTSFLDFYNKANGAKKSNISTTEIKEFIELFKYIDSPTLLDDARKQGTTAVKLLTQEKERYLSFEKDIQEFIVDDEKSYFAGETPLNIYKNYRDVLLENPFDVKTILQNAIDYNMANQKDYSVKTIQIGKFAKFFEDKQALTNFFTQNNITFDGSDTDNERINNSFSIFNTLYDENDKEKSMQRINYFAKSGFIAKSEKRLSEFLQKMPSDEVKRNVLSIVADRKIPSLTQMEKFFKQYETENTTGKTLIQYLRELPENISFVDSLTALARIQTQINQLSLPVHISGDNLVSIDLSRFNTKGNISTADTISVLNSIYNAPQGTNFLSVMSDLETEEESIGAYRIAKEIAKRIDKSDESYQNISRLLHLDKQSLNLDENCSTYIYTRAIQEVLPKEFIDFVKSNDWIQYSTESEKMPALSFHARLRAIDRFALDGVNDIKELYTEKSKNKLKSLMQTVYTTNPTEINSNGSEKRLIADFDHNGREIEVVFSQNGKMVTIVPRSRVA